MFNNEQLFERFRKRETYYDYMHSSMFRETIRTL